MSVLILLQISDCWLKWITNKKDEAVTVNNTPDLFLPLVVGCSMDRLSCFCSDASPSRLHLFPGSLCRDFGSGEERRASRSPPPRRHHPLRAEHALFSPGDGHRTFPVTDILYSLYQGSLILSQSIKIDPDPLVFVARVCVGSYVHACPSFVPRDCCTLVKVSDLLPFSPWFFQWPCC